MARTENSADSVSLNVTVSKQSASLLEQIAEDGVYGKSRAEVAARFIDRVLAEEYVIRPRFKMVLARKGNVRSPVRAEEDESTIRDKKKGARKR